jgi:ketosteroid isomerase-like protein
VHRNFTLPIFLKHFNGHTAERQTNMTTQTIKMITRTSLCFIASLLIFNGSQAVQAQTSATAAAEKTDDQTIRQLVQQENDGNRVIKYTDDSIFVSGAFPRPIIGRKQFDAMKPRREEMKKARPNEKMKSDIQRLVISQSGDLAYEYGDFNVSFDSKNKKRTGFSGSYLRVWRKVNGEWLVDAFFARPNES